MLTKFTFPLIALSALTLAHGLDISGNVVTKLDSPISGAKVCLTADTTHCVTTDSEGAFQIKDGNAAIRPNQKSTMDFALEFAGGRFTLMSPNAEKASLTWSDSRGRVLQSWNGMQLAKGRNGLAWPGLQLQSGMYFMHLSAPNHTLTWKAMVMGSSKPASISGGEPTAPSARVVLSKATASLGSLRISKNGYNTRTYQPGTAIEVGDWIYLTATTDVGITFTGTATAVISRLDKTNHILVVSSQENYCEGNNRVKDTVIDTSQYFIRSGTLYIWHPGDCYGTSMTGTATDIVGAWTLTGPRVDLPTDLKTANCRPDSSGGGNDFNPFTASYNITTTTITANLSYDDCPGDNYTQDLISGFMSDTSVQVTQNTCKQAAFTNGKNETASLAYAKKGDSLIGTFTYKTKTCILTEDRSFSPVPATCPDTTDPALHFDACVMASGFANVSTVLAKTSALLRTELSGTTNGVSASSVSSARRWPMSLEHKPISHVTSPLPVQAQSIFPWHERKLPAR